jgi:hypothetical protein
LEPGLEIALHRFGQGESCILTADAVLSQQTLPAIATVKRDPNHARNQQGDGVNPAAFGEDVTPSGNTRVEGNLPELAQQPGIGSLQDRHGAGDTVEMLWVHLSPAHSQWSVVSERAPCRLTDH